MSSSNGAKPELAINQWGNSVASSVTGFIEGAASAYAGGAQVDIATAYFNVEGYVLLANALDKAENVRMLLGAEPMPPENAVWALRTERNRTKAVGKRIEKSLKKQERITGDDFNRIGFSQPVHQAGKRLVDWLRSGRVEVRRLEGEFLHGKAFLVTANPSTEMESSDATSETPSAKAAQKLHHGVISGSSNFTKAGLTTNIELNLGNYSPYVLEQVSNWYDELWDKAVDYDLAALFEPRFDLHPPQLIYLRMLWERYKDELAKDGDDDPASFSKIRLTSFQKAGLTRAREFLDRYNGVLFADEVGLGKTYFAGKLIEEATIRDRQRVLVVCPATLRDGPWRAFKAEFGLPVEIVSYEELALEPMLQKDGDRKAEAKSQLKARHPNDYALVVVDEAHNLRNPSTQRAEALRRLLTGTPPKKLVLLTATPVNNSLWDLYNLISYFLRNDGVFADKGIKSMRDHFAHAMRLEPSDLSPKHLFDVIDAVTVRRTRSFVKEHYSSDTVQIKGKEQQVVFPTPKVQKVTYDMNHVLPGFFDKVSAALNPDADPKKDPRVLTLARYMPSHYRLEGAGDRFEFQMAGLLRSSLLKRFESSPYAFAQTCRRMAASCDAFAKLVKQGVIATGAALVDWIATDSDDLDEVDKYLDAHADVHDDADDHDKERLLTDTQRDSKLLKVLAAEAETVTQQTDPNLAALCDELSDIAAKAGEGVYAEQDIRDRRKVLIFSYYTDTVNWIVEFLEQAVRDDERLIDYQGRIASITGSDESKAGVLYGFAPQTTDPPDNKTADLYDIVVTTDVLAEGVNLQQARHIINYDLPWNPMRLVQRHGRIDRIGSQHPEVFIRCVFPDAHLDEMLNLEQVLQSKIAQAAVSVGVGPVLPGQKGVDLNFADTREEIDRLREGNPLIFEQGGTANGTQSGEEFRKELEKALEDSNWCEKITQLPWGSGAAMQVSDDYLGAIDKVGFVFCARAGDWTEPQFTYVEMPAPASQTSTGKDHKHNDDGSAEQIDISAWNTLPYLQAAKPANSFDTESVMNEDILILAFEAWTRAQADIVKRWNYFSDPRNLEPSIPKAFREAAEVIRSHPPAELSQAQINHAVDCLTSPYPERITRVIRFAMQSSQDDPKRQSKSVLQVIKDQGLAPSPPPLPRPPISEDDLHLVCWQALVPQPEVVSS